MNNSFRNRINRAGTEELLLLWSRNSQSMPERKLWAKALELDARVGHIRRILSTGLKLR